MRKKRFGAGPDMRRKPSAERGEKAFSYTLPYALPGAKQAQNQ